jgi:hypothetical protein
LNMLLWWESVPVYCIHVCMVCLIIYVVHVHVLLGLDRWYSNYPILPSRLHVLFCWSASSQGTKRQKCFWFPRVSIISCVVLPYLVHRFPTH